MTRAEVHLCDRRKSATCSRSNSRPRPKPPTPAPRSQAGMTFDELASRRGLKPAQISLGTLAQDELPDADARQGDLRAAPERSQPAHQDRLWRLCPGAGHQDRARHLQDARRREGRASPRRCRPQLAAGKLVDVVNAYTDARSGGADMKDAAKKAGMKVSHLARPWTSTAWARTAPRPMCPPIRNSCPPCSRREVGEDTDPFATKPGAYYAVKVNGMTPPKLKPLDQVRARRWPTGPPSSTASCCAKRAGAGHPGAKDNSLDGIAKELKVPVQHSPSLTRQTNDTMFNAAMVARAVRRPARRRGVRRRKARRAITSSPASPASPIPS